MKTPEKSFFLALLLVFLFNFINCSREKSSQAEQIKKINLDSITFTHSMKGWELYSWPNGCDWNYSILPGTNRSKTYDEVKGNRVTVFGKDSLKMLLDKFPAGEYLFWVGKGWLGNSWSGNSGNMSLPDSSIINEIQGYCIQKKIVLNIAN